MVPGGGAAWRKKVRRHGPVVLLVLGLLLLLTLAALGYVVYYELHVRLRRHHAPQIVVVHAPPPLASNDRVTPAEAAHALDHVSSSSEAQAISSIVLVTRFFGSDADYSRFLKFLQRVQHMVNDIVILVNHQQDRSGASKALKAEFGHAMSGVHVLDLMDWEGVTGPLNASIKYIESTIWPTPKHVLFASPEVEFLSKDLRALYNAMDGGTLVAGALMPGHANPTTLTRSSSSEADAQIGESSLLSRAPLSGDTSPWNTFALWDFGKLRRTLFPGIADEQSPPGMEEIGAIAAHFASDPSGSRAKLLIPTSRNKQVVWNTDQLDGDRLTNHKEKIRSKNARAKNILAAMNSSGVSVDFVYI
ncbi:hypothetical protein FVE85_6714 [Porphyridium purpureum]|uniref:Uncharacterized protein n=1 Tax=Porphyridium purpureum TaxID=35688 RepID=A0A5J4Z531_PORPP|nr:hypothetical protein FVE85_6714 [Porphyridium purpureum]|eukprot:POR9450..scf295_1